MILTTFKKALAIVKRKHYYLTMVLTNIKEKIKTMRVFTPKKQQHINRRNRKPAVPLSERHDIIGVLLVLLVASIAYSSIAVWFNISTAGLVPKFMLLPQIIAGAGILIWKFTK